MNLFSKKKMFALIDTLEEGVKTLKAEKAERLDPVWVENMNLFLQLIRLLESHLTTLETTQERQYEACFGLIQAFCEEGQKIVEGANTPPQRLETCKKMTQLLKKIQFEVKKNVPEDKKELVFFPYLYAMWDSLESVWRAAVESGEYEVSVVPIPYYSRNADGSLGEMRYEGALYPPEVNVIHWENYSLQEQKPHVAYVHNPYDDINKVTSIHPNFYSDKLKPHVGSLVYIPYFVAPNDEVQPHFCLTPVTMRADKIIVQSEEAAKTYVERIYGMKGHRNPKLKKSQVEEMVLALGSPKMDRIVRSKEQLLENLPKEWMPLLRKEDGTLKKAIFYNLSISTLLIVKDPAGKWRDALAHFQQQSADFVLWWRPHPLLASTMVSMRPAVLKEYQEIVEEFRRAGWGIFDDVTELHTAVEYCDAYYGDVSSVVSLFENAKKPVMIQNCYVKTLESEKNHGL